MWQNCSVQHVSQAPAPLDAQNAQPIPIPKAAEARGQRPGAGRRRALGLQGHLDGRCCLTAGATTDHTCSPDAWRLRHPDRWITTLRVPLEVHVLQCWYRYGRTAVHMVIYNFATWLHTLRNLRISDSPVFIRF